MKTIYISLPISGHEDTYEERLLDAIDWCEKEHPDTRIITPNHIASYVDRFSMLKGLNMGYADYLLSDLQFIMDDADAILMCDGWEESRGCRIEHMVAKEFGKEVIYKTNQKAK